MIITGIVLMTFAGLVVIIAGQIQSHDRRIF